MHDQGVESCRIHFEMFSINTQEYVKCGECRPFVAIHKRLIDQQAFHQGASLFQNIGVIAALWPIDGRLHGPHIPDAGSSAVTFEQYGMQPKNIGSFEIIPAHLDRAP